MVPLCCEGTIGAGECSAFIADAAEEPGPADAMDCGRAVEIPEMGSVLDAGHSTLGAFFRAAHVDPSPTGEGPTPFVCEDDVDKVELVEACEERDEDEFVRWALLRGMNILKSSVLMGAAPLGTPLAALHPCREMFWKFGGGATAVIDLDVRSERLPVNVFSESSVNFSHTHPEFTGS